MPHMFSAKAKRKAKKLATLRTKPKSHRKPRGILAEHGQRKGTDHEAREKAAKEAEDAANRAQDEARGTGGRRRGSSTRRRTRRTVKIIRMKKGEYLREHHHLFRVLRNPTRRALNAELRAQQRELKERGLRG